MLPIPELAAATIANLAYLSRDMSDAARQRAGDCQVVRYDRLRTRLSSEIGREVLASFEQRQAAPEARAVLGQALKSRLSEDPTFRADLDGLVEEISPWM
ncbi:MAG: hypothetical protein QOJ16_2743 [Acidobacteriota bacterium]|jgi:hypothetical protein|nr:hypothetical protein [Acidobacteriota bacterium]